MPKATLALTFVNILHTPCKDLLCLSILEILPAFFYNKYKSSIQIHSEQN